MRPLLALAVLTLGLAGAQAAPSGVLTLRFLDVGQGDAVLVTAPTGQTLLYDGGRSESRMRDLIRQYGVTRIDLAAASHGDADHITGLIPAIALFKPKLFLNNGIAATTQTYGRLLNVVGQAGTQGLLAKEQVINLGAVKLTVIPPPPGMPRNDQNANSVGLLLQYGTFRALLTGDSETPQTQAWLRQKASSFWGPVHVYKSIHHGAANGDSAAWLAAVRPKNVVIGVGPNNYGHPTASALNLYRKVGATVYRTDQQGTVTVTVQPGGKYAITTERRETVQPAPAATPAPRSQPAPVPVKPPVSSVSYPNCAAARAVGAAPVRVGQPGYGRHLDRDGDGVGCE